MASYGPCEICGTTTRCYEVPVSRLPPTKDEQEEKPKMKGQNRDLTPVIAHLRYQAAFAAAMDDNVEADLFAHAAFVLEKCNTFGNKWREH
jgi:DNA-binding ferritin-like protein